MDSPRAPWGDDGGAVSTGFIRLKVPATLPSCGRPTGPEASVPPPPRRSSRTATEAKTSAPPRALRRADLGDSVVPVDLGGASITMSSSIALAEKYRSLGFLERALMITASMR